MSHTRDLSSQSATTLVHDAQSFAQSNAPSKETQFKVAKAAGALKAGKMPTEEQLSKLISTLLSSPLLSTTTGERTGRMSSEGAAVVSSLKTSISTFQKLLDAKNGDNKVQRLIWESSEIDLDADLDVADEELPSRKEGEGDARKLQKSLKDIAVLMGTSGEFRKLISDFVVIGRDILADAAVVIADNAKDAANATRPSESERDQGIDFQRAKAKGKKAAKGLQSGRIQGQAYEDGENKIGQVKEYFDEKLPDQEEAKDRLIESLKRTIIATQMKPEYKDAVHTIIDLFKKYYSIADSAVSETADSSTVQDKGDHLDKASQHFKHLIEAFASGKSVDPIIDQLKVIKKDIENDQRLGDYFEEIGNYLERCLLQTGYVTSQRCARKAGDLFDKGQNLIKENTQWKEDASKLQSQLEAYSRAIDSDKDTNNFILALEDLADELEIAGKSGLRALKAESSGLWRDLVDVFIPRAIALVKEVPMPRIEFKSEAIDIVIDHAAFESASFIPDNIRFVNHNDLSLTQGYAAFAADYDTSVKLHVDGLRMSAKNISYWFNKKTGFPSFEDSGLLDIDFGGKGISFDVKLENASEQDKETFFTVAEVKVDISDFTFTVSNNQKWFSFWLAKPFVTSLLKKNVTEALEQQITNYLGVLDLQLYGLQQRSIAAANARPDPLNFIKAVIFPSLFSSSSTSKFTQVGVVKYGRRGEYILAIGADEQLFPGKAGASDDYAKRKEIKHTVQEITGQAEGAASNVKGAARAKADEAKARGDKLTGAAKKEARRAALEDGWMSDAFDI